MSAQVNLREFDPSLTEPSWLGPPTLSPSWHAWVALGRCVLATNHVVGGDQESWHISGNPTFYQDWANSNGPYRFRDTLEFRYGLGDSVIQVNEVGFNGCDLRNAIGFWSEDGHMFLSLVQTGRFYFISGSGHGGAGQKFFVDVVV